MRIIAACAVLALVGCAAPAPYRASGVTVSAADKALRECEYEATKATANIINGFEAGWMMGTIKHQCMESKGFTR
jgi:tellurite resistance protein